MWYYGIPCPSCTWFLPKGRGKNAVLWHLQKAKSERGRECLNPEFTSRADKAIKLQRKGMNNYLAREKEKARQKLLDECEKRDLAPTWKNMDYAKYAIRNEDAANWSWGGQQAHREEYVKKHGLKKEMPVPVLENSLFPRPTPSPVPCPTPQTSAVTPRETCAGLITTSRRRGLLGVK